MKFRVDGLGLFASRYDTLEEARSNNYDKKGRRGNVIVEMEENEYINLIKGYESRLDDYKIQLDKNTAANNALHQENQGLKKQIETLQETLVHPQVMENLKREARRLMDAEINAREKLKEELTGQIEALTRREEGLRDALARWQKKATGEDVRPPKDIKQMSVQYQLRFKAGKKLYSIEKYLPLPSETGFDELEEYAKIGLPEEKGAKIKRIYLSQGKWVVEYVW